MGYQIIKQPDDLFAVFSSYTDTIVVWDATQAEVVDWFVEIAVEDTKQRVNGLIGHVSAGESRKAYYQFAMSWEEAQERDREHGGDFSAGAVD